MIRGAAAGAASMKASSHSPMRRAVVAAVFFGLIGLSWGLANRGRFAPRPDRGSQGFVFEEVAEQIGIRFVHQETCFDPKIAHIMPQVAGLGAAVSVTDADQDGWPDLYFTSSKSGSKNALYMNRRNGSFEDVAEEAGIADVNRDGVGASMGSIWADIDNDGREDCFLYKYGKPQLFRHAGFAPGGAPRFEDATAASGLERWMNSNAACWIDYDRNGLVDLFVAGYFSEKFDLWNLTTTRIMQESMEFANNGGSNYLFKNLGNGRFRDVTEETDTGSTRWSLAVSSADFDSDGWPDLFIANDFGTESLLLNVKGERFREARNVGLNLTAKSGMSVALGDTANRGLVDAFVTNIFKEGFSPQGNNMRMNLLAASGRFSNTAEGELANCGWAWGAQFGDFDNDGSIDLFVVNGFVSADPEREYWYDMSRIATGAGGILADAANWAPMEGRSLSGYERSRVLHNDGHGGFTDVAATVGVTDVLDGRGLALADLFQRGCLDAVVANQRERVLVYRNDPDPTRDWIQIRLRATRSNRSAIGAQVLLEWRNESGVHRQLQSIDGGSGFSSQNEKKFHFGLGRGAGPATATVLWPSGVPQRVEGLAPRRIHEIREP